MIVLTVGEFRAEINNGAVLIRAAGVVAVSFSEKTTEIALTRAFRTMEAATKLGAVSGRGVSASDLRMAVNAHLLADTISRIMRGHR